MTVDHEKLRREHPLNKFGRPLFTPDERDQLGSGYRSDGSFRSTEACAVEDHRRAENAENAVLNHQPSPHHPCPLCRGLATEEALRDLVEAAAPYIDRAAPHEQMFDADDLRNFERLSQATADAKRALSSQVDTPAEGSVD